MVEVFCGEGDVVGGTGVVGHRGGKGGIGGGSASACEGRGEGPSAQRGERRKVSHLTVSTPRTKVQQGTRRNTGSTVF